MPVQEAEVGQGIVRWVPAASMLAVFLISYIDRNTLALLAPTILREPRAVNVTKPAWHFGW